MIVKCLYTNIAECGMDSYPWGGSYSASSEIYDLITPGRSYVVYAIGSSYDGMVFYICQDDITSFPIPFPACLFKVVDGRFSKYWLYRGIVNKSVAGIMWSEVISYPEWCNDTMYFENLLNEENNSHEVFAIYKEKIDKEAGFDPNINADIPALPPES